MKNILSVLVFGLVLLVGCYPITNTKVSRNTDTNLTQSPTKQNVKLCVICPLCSAPVGCLSEPINELKRDKVLVCSKCGYVIVLKKKIGV